MRLVAETAMYLQIHWKTILMLVAQQPPRSWVYLKVKHHEVCSVNDIFFTNLIIVYLYLPFSDIIGKYGFLYICEPSFVPIFSQRQKNVTVRRPYKRPSNSCVTETRT